MGGDGREWGEGREAGARGGKWWYGGGKQGLGTVSCPPPLSFWNRLLTLFIEYGNIMFS